MTVSIAKTDVPAKKKYRKDKRELYHTSIFHHLSHYLSLSDAAWDTEDIDHWKTVVIEPGQMPAPLLEESSFATLFPRYREKYLQQIWPHVKRTLKDHVNKTITSL